MRHKLFATFLCVITCVLSKADAVLPANCAVAPTICANTPTATGSLQLITYDFRSQSNEDYTSGTVTSDSHTLVDPTLHETVSGSVTVGFDGIHGSSSVVSQGSGGSLAQFGGQIVDYFQVTGNVPRGAQLEVTYGADILSNASIATSSDYMVSLVLNSATCLSGFHEGNFTSGCTAFIPLSTGDHTAELDLRFRTELNVSGLNSAFLNAINTAKFDTITVVDASGNPLSGLQLYDASGYNYDASVSPVATPEPSSFFLLTTGLAAMKGLVKRRVAR